MQPGRHLGLIFVALCRQAENVPGAGGLELGKQVAERAGLRRAAARPRNHVPIVDQRDLAGLAGPWIGKHHGAPPQRRQRYRGIVGGNQTDRRDRHAHQVRRRTIVVRRRNLVPIDSEQVSLVHGTSLSIQQIQTSWRGGAFAPTRTMKPRGLIHRDARKGALLRMREPPYPRARSRRPFSLLQSRFFSLSRLSCSFLPFATASRSLARPRSLKQSFSGISVMPSRSTAPISLLICFLCSNSLRGRFGSWLKRLACRYSGILALISQISPFFVSA